ncbi:GNAT family N-acetyltransferase [Halomonas denitrificans]|nr:GNAT family N-acetyltransferase [Halomonas denitrificans]
MIDEAYVQEPAVPDVAEYCDLRTRCGLSPKRAGAASKGLPNSLFSTVIRREGALVAMGRVVGDGGCNFEVVDVAVHPDHQRRGLGTRIMRAIREWLDDNAPETAYVSLIADHHSPKLYSKFGFEPTTPRSIGMAYSVRRRDPGSK